MSNYVTNYLLRSTSSLTQVDMCRRPFQYYLFHGSKSLNSDVDPDSNSVPWFEMDQNGNDKWITDLKSSLNAYFWAKTVEK